MTISVEILISIFFVLLTPIVISLMWVKGIDYMQKNHPDYKGYDLFDEEGEEDKPLDEDEKDDIKD
jgi:hypothetical protein